MPSLVSTTAGLGGMEQLDLVGGRVMMDERRMVALSGVVVRRRQLDRARYMQQYNTKDGLVAGGCGGLIPGRRPG